MMFNSLVFAGFLAVVFAGCWVLGGWRRARNLFLRVASAAALKDCVPSGVNDDKGNGIICAVR